MVYWQNLQAHLMLFVARNALNASGFFSSPIIAVHIHIPATVHCSHQKRQFDANTRFNFQAVTNLHHNSYKSHSLVLKLNSLTLLKDPLLRTPYTDIEAFFTRISEEDYYRDVEEWQNYNEFSSLSVTVTRIALLELGHKIYTPVDRNKNRTLNSICLEEVIELGTNEDLR